MTRIGIVGGGITGLALAHYLAERDVEFEVFEATDEPGGVIRSGEIEGHVLEWGPQRLRLSDSVEALINDLDLGEEVIEADRDLPMYVYAREELRRVPFSLGEFLRTDLLSWRAKLRVLAEPLTSPGHEDETAAELFTRKFGEETYRNLLGPLFGGIYASDPAEMPARHALEGMLRLEERDGSLLRAAIGRAGKERPPAASFEDGMQRLPEALAGRYDASIRFETPVESIRSWGEKYRIETPEGNREFDRVVVTTPADVTADILEHVEPAARRFEDITYNPLAVVHLYAETDAEGLGYQVGYDEELHTLGVSWNASAFDRDGIYTAFLGGMHEPELLEKEPHALGEIARREFKEVMDVEAAVLSVSELDRGFPAYDHSWDRIEGIELPERIHMATNYTSRMGVPSRIREARDLAETLAGASGAARTTTPAPTS